MLNCRISDYRRFFIIDSIFVKNNCNINKLQYSWLQYSCNSVCAICGNVVPHYKNYITYSYILLPFSDFFHLSVSNL